MFGCIDLSLNFWFDVILSCKNVYKESMKRFVID